MMDSNATPRMMENPTKPSRTPLMFAAMNFVSVDYDFDAVKALIEAGADVNAKDDEGKTALIYAAIYNHTPEVAKALVEAGAEINAKDNEGRTALSWAACNHNPQVLKALVEAGADVNA